MRRPIGPCTSCQWRKNSSTLMPGRLVMQYTSLITLLAYGKHDLPFLNAPTLTLSVRWLWPPYLMTVALWSGRSTMAVATAGALKIWPLRPPAIAGHPQWSRAQGGDIAVQMHLVPEFYGGDPLLRRISRIRCVEALIPPR